MDPYFNDICNFEKLNTAYVFLKTGMTKEIIVHSFYGRPGCNCLNSGEPIGTEGRIVYMILVSTITHTLFCFY